MCSVLEKAGRTKTLEKPYLNVDLILVQNELVYPLTRNPPEGASDESLAGSPGPAVRTHLGDRQVDSTSFNVLNIAFKESHLEMVVSQ